MAEKTTNTTRAATAETKNTAKNAARPSLTAGRASPNLSNHTEPTLPLHHVGHTLKEARENRGLTVDDLANELMIRRYYLQAIEDGNYKTLPDRVYAMGFVRNYSDYLGLDSNALTEQFRREAYSGRNHAAKVELAFPEPVSHNIVPGKTALLGGLVLAAIALAVGLYMAQNQSDLPEVTLPAANSNVLSPAITPPMTADTIVNDNSDDISSATVPALPTTSAVTPATATTTVPTSATNTDNETATLPPAMPTAAADVRVSNLPQINTTPTATPVSKIAPPATSITPNMTASLVIKQPSWVEIRNSQGQTLLSKIAKIGDVLPLPDQAGLTLTLGNAGGVLLQVGDAPQAAFGPAGEVRRNIKLDSILEAAKAKLAPPTTTAATPPNMPPAPTSLPAAVTAPIGTQE